MITVEEALERVLAHLPARRVAMVGLRDAVGEVLAEDVAAEEDSPPFDKALMDGYALLHADVAAGRAEWEVAEVVYAGALPTQTAAAGRTVRIMTGAMLPAGADLVVPHEETESRDGGRRMALRRVLPGMAPGWNVMRRGASGRAGEVVVPAGTRLRAQAIGALAELGRVELQVWARPRVAVLATGNELVPCEREPGPGQIRNSNEPMLLAQLRQFGAEASGLGIACDEAGELQTRIEAGLKSDILLISGGVSAGDRDLIPGALARAGVRCLFHGLNLRPGKPLWFGTHDADARRTLVFGLPGNPVSSMVCAELFVGPAVRALRGMAETGWRTFRAALQADVALTGDRRTFFPAHWTEADGGRVVHALPWEGSSDLRGTAIANGLIDFRQGGRTYAAGEIVDVVEL